MNDEHLNIDSEYTKKTRIKSILIEIFISLFISFLLTLSTILIEIYVNGLDYESEKLRIYADGFFVSGILTTLFYILVLLSHAGAFDFLVYSTKKFFSFIFKRKVDETKLPASYYEYVVLKRGRKFNRRLYYLSVSILFLIIGIILSLLCL